jgi:quercetin dioxygenase-like cupin family protein
MFLSLIDMPEKEIVSGFFAKFLHTNAVTIGHVRIVAGSELPTHQHFHAQTTQVISGALSFTLDGETQLLSAGSVVHILPNLPHSAKALTDCYVIDVFCPVREDYR